MANSSKGMPTTAGLRSNPRTIITKGPKLLGAEALFSVAWALLSLSIGSTGLKISLDEQSAWLQRNNRALAYTVVGVI
jgi:hypothetical protein